MKNSKQKTAYKFILIVFIFSFLSPNAQNQEVSALGLYKWNGRVFMQPCDAKGTEIPNSDLIISESGQYFTILAVGKSTVEPYYIIQISAYKDKKGKIENDEMTRTSSDFLKSKYFLYNYQETKDSSYKLRSKIPLNLSQLGSNQKFFKVSIEIVKEKAIREDRIGAGVAFGVMNFPFKFRLQNTDFTSNFNLGASIGIKCARKSWRKSGLSFLVGYGMSTINLDSASVTKNHQKLVSTNNFSAISLSIGCLFEFEKVQAGFFFGWDRMNRLNQKEFGWIYQAKPWVSIGFGYSIFSIEKETSSSSKTNSEGN